MTKVSFKTDYGDPFILPEGLDPIQLFTSLEIWGDMPEPTIIIGENVINESFKINQIDIVDVSDHGDYELYLYYFDTFENKLKTYATMSFDQTCTKYIFSKTLNPGSKILATIRNNLNQICSCKIKLNGEKFP